MDAGPSRAPGRAAPYPDSDKTATSVEAVVSWLVLVLSGVLESVWATALGRSEGFSRLGPSVVFAVALVLSMAGLAYALRELPTGTAYAVWVGIGAALTVGIGMVTGEEPVSALRLLLVAGIVGCVIGLKALH
jgi:quaternary ammonium compound-resistance protein SugE